MQESISGLTAVLLGFSIVFFGLICLVYITKAMSLIFNRPVKSINQEQSHVPAMDKGQFTAAVAAAIALSMGSEPGGLRIHSIKKL